MSEPHKVSVHRWYHDLWWVIRGVSGKHWRTKCARCGHAGMAHFAWRHCWRFKPQRISMTSTQN
jgi:hypothetical protein